MSTYFDIFEVHQVMTTTFSPNISVSRAAMHFCTQGVYSLWYIDTFHVSFDENSGLESFILNISFSLKSFDKKRFMQLVALEIT